MDVPVLVHPAEILWNSAAILIGIRQHKQVLFADSFSGFSVREYSDSDDVK